MSAQPTPEMQADARPGNVSLNAVSEVIARSTERIVGSPGFIDRLAAAIVAQQRQTGDIYPFAATLEELEHHHVVVAPQPTAEGNLLILSQLPLRGGQNINVVAVAKDFTQVGQPTAEGEELANYVLLLYMEERAGAIQGRRTFDLAKMEEGPQLLLELHRQLAALKLGQSAFFFLNILAALNKAS